MRRRGVPADEITMNSILDGLVSCTPPRVREAETVMTLMVGWGLKPNQVRVVCCARSIVSVLSLMEPIGMECQNE